LGLIEPITGFDEVVSRGKVIGSVGHDETPSIVTGAELQRTHQPELQGLTAVFPNDTNPTEIAGIFHVR
jgi:hypothetical protein